MAASGLVHCRPLPDPSQRLDGSRIESGAFDSTCSKDHRPMSRPSKRNKNSTEHQLCPPKAGWDLMAAADALCPQEAALYRQGGSALEAAVDTAMAHEMREI